jgi:chondroitin 4-sulfotransferase 11
MINNKYNFIYIHINKTGGRSVEKLFDNKCDHTYSLEYIKKLGRKKYNSYFKFTFVRNPWDRLVSQYSFRRQLAIRTVRCDLMDNFKDWAKCAYHPDRKVKRKIKKKNQLDWIIDKKGNIAVDFVGRFENINEDWKKICTKLSIDLKLPHANKSKHKHYTEYYDDELIELVRNKFKKDIKYFGYEYGEN